MAADSRGPDFTNFEPTTRGLFGLFNSYVGQQPGCPRVTAEAVISLALPFMEPIQDVRHIAYFWGAPFWIVKQLPLGDIRLGKLIKILLKIQEHAPPTLDDPVPSTTC
jgi:hypothetical protein